MDTRGFHTYGTRGAMPGRVASLGRRAGFTLLEVLIAISVLVVVVGIVYESLQAVTNATEVAREQDSDIRVRDFLLRNFSTNLATVYADVGLLNTQFELIGKNEGNGIDTLDFCSSAPLMGGASEPGLLKHVHYGEAENKASSDGGVLAPENTEDSASMFEATERLLRESSDYVASSSGGGTTNMLTSKLRLDTHETELVEGADEVTPTWSIPVEAVDFQYYDGDKWVEEWDSSSMMRMPWCIRVRINFVRSAEDASSGGARTLGEQDEGDFQMYISLPMSVGVRNDAGTWQQIVAATSVYAGS